MDVLSRPLIPTIAVAVAVALAAAAVGATGEPIQLAVAGRSNATVSIAASGSLVTAAWSAADASGATDIYVAVSRDAGATFSAPVRANDAAGAARVSGEQPPRVSLVAAKAGDPAIAVVWTAKGEHGTRLLMARSSDGGRSFSRAAPVPGSDAAGNRGWEALTTSPTGVMSAVWLDHRGLAAPEVDVVSMHHASGAHAKSDGVPTAQRSKLYFASLDASVPPRAITGGVCYCCKTALVSAADGSLYAAWRQVYPGNIRDIAFSASRDGGRTFAPPVRVSEDKWVLEGCPDDGPAMAVGRDGAVHVVWPTLVTEGGEQTIALFYASSKDGRTFTPRMRVPAEGMPHHPQIAIDEGMRVVLAWDEMAGGSRRAVAARVTGERPGRLGVARTVLDQGRVGLYPALAATRAGVVAAWTSGVAPDAVIRIARVP